MNKEQEWERKQQAYDLRLRGRSYRQIANECSVSVGTAHRWVQEVLDAIVLPTVEAIRKQEIDRLMRYLDKLDERIEEGDDKAIGIAIKVSERLTKMLGVDAPQQLQVERTDTTPVDKAILDLVSDMNKRNAERKAAAVNRRVAASDIDGMSDADEWDGALDSSVEDIVREN